MGGQTNKQQAEKCGRALDISNVQWGDKQTNKQTTSRDKQNAGPGGQEGILSKEFKGESIFHDVK